MSIVYNYMLYFFIYSFLGWVCESIYCSCLQKKIINRGFLNGPVCPVYGVGALIIIINSSLLFTIFRNKQYFNYTI